MGLTWLLAALGVYFRDVQNVMGFVTTALFYMSGIFYAPQTVGADSRAKVAIEILRYNPIFRAIELSRDVLLWQLPLDKPGLAYLYITCGAVFFLGYAAFQKMKGGFADVL
jgi:lipopolysaccharide transport system permease protein